MAIGRSAKALLLLSRELLKHLVALALALRTRCNL
jgi:hypothetical protein